MTPEQSFRFGRDLALDPRTGDVVTGVHYQNHITRTVTHRMEHLVFFRVAHAARERDLPLEKWTAWCRKHNTHIVEMVDCGDDDGYVPPPPPPAPKPFVWQPGDRNPLTHPKVGDVFLGSVSGHHSIQRTVVVVHRCYVEYQTRTGTHFGSMLTEDWLEWCAKPATSVIHAA